jgi:hypothetical protein
MERQSTNAPGSLFGEASSGEGGPPSMGAMGGPPSMGGTGGAAGGTFGGEDLSSVLGYTEAHGGGTIALDSQSGAAASIIEGGAEVAGIGGFSGKESSVSAAWLEERIDSGAISWIYVGGSGSGMTGGPGGVSAGGEGGAAGALPGGQGGGPSAGAGGDTRTGSESAIDTVVKSCTKVTALEGDGTLYQCGGS